MAIYTYTGTLADLGGSPFPGAFPKLYVVADRDTFGPNGPIPANKRVEIPVASDGSFAVQLTASADLSPSVRYTLRCEWLDGETPLGWAEWDFTAYGGGGPIKDGVSAPASVWWVGPPWPSGLPSGWYLNRFTNDVGRKE